ncbi:MAG: aminopeptidase YwaD [Rhodothermales bacterium]|jgi:aminopeptidase YwaD
MNKHVSSAFLLLSVSLAVAACHDSGPVQSDRFPVSSPTHELADRVADRFSGDRAFETVAYMDQFVRWPGNRGFDASVHHIAERLAEAGFVREDEAPENAPLTYRIERYPMDTPAWEPLGASVTLAGSSEPVLDFATNRNMLARSSHATKLGGVDAQLIDIADRSDVDCVEMRGHIVLADASAGRVFRRAVRECGALGVLGYSLPAYLQPEKNQESIQFGSIPYSEEPGWAISLSYAANQKLRAALADGPVRVNVKTEVAWTPDADELTVVAEVKGAQVPDERFVFSAHIQEPGANDNASGVGAQLEMARVAAEMVQAGAYSADRTITFLWGLEIRSTARYIQQDSVRALGIKWGLSLDMVGEDIQKTGGTFLIEKMPDPSAVWTRGDEKHSEWGGRPLTLEDMMPHYFNDYVLNRARETAQTTDWLIGTNPYEGGSDHVPFLRADIPSVLFWHFTDQFYHTDGDRIDKVSAQELSNVGRTALVSAMRLASADGETAHALISEIANAALDRLEVEARLSMAAVASGDSLDDQAPIIEAWAEWYSAALASVSDLEPTVEIPLDHLERAQAAVTLARSHALDAVAADS